MNGDADRAPTYLDLTHPDTRLAFPEEVTTFIRTGGADLSLFWRDTGETRVVPGLRLV